LSATPEIDRKTVLGPDEIAEGVADLARQIAYQCGGDEVAFVGLYTRGVTLARRVAALLEKEGLRYPVGTLDISLYRDDFSHRADELPRLETSDIPFSLDGIRVILFDEVIYTGRTIRAALDGLMDYGRPAKIELAVLVDRGHREIPIQPDYLAKRVGTTRDQYVKVSFREDDDGEEGVHLETPRKAPAA
jgi:pyrimidine operon attenuation protein/uracil phosphoribosyltransferase